MKPEERRNQLLDCAQMLFFTKGFDDTTMQDIIDLAGVSKGGFYHHFKSKDELLFGVLDRMAADVFGQMSRIAEDSATPALERLHQFIHLRANYLKQNDMAGQVEFFRIMNDEKNSVLLDGFKRTVKREALPVLTWIIRQGQREGTFKVTDPDTAAELILYLSTFMDAALLRAIDARGTDHATTEADRLRVAMEMQFLTYDRILGLPDGTTSFGWPDVVDVTMAIVPQNRPGVPK